MPVPATTGRARRAGAPAPAVPADGAARTHAPAGATPRLDRYDAKRDFTRTPEPGAGHATAAGAGSFVVQRHDATRLHWDFRLEHDGVLVSWAVPRGPSLDPHDKRLAVHVEDHPLAYASFEGTIPAGNYGAGTVAIWDRGTWEPLGDTAAGLAAGELKFVLHGTRLQGRFVLIRLRPRPREHAENWLLIKEHDEHERLGAAAEVLSAIPLPAPAAAPARAGKRATRKAGARSTITDAPGAPPEPNPGNAAPARPARAKAGAGTDTSRDTRPRKAAAGPAAPPRPTRRSGEQPGRTSASVPAATPGEPTLPDPHPIPPDAPHGPLPDTQAPQLATAVDAPPDGPGWISEVKFDGYRLLAFKHGAVVRLMTRNGLDWTARLPSVARAVGRLAVRDALLDGELVALQPDGLSSFPALQAALAGKHDDRLYFYLFDLLHLDGRDLRPCALSERKAVLAGIDPWQGRLRYSDHLDGDAARVRRQACSMGLEGILCKDPGAPYRAGRGRAWQKVKCQGREEFVVLGWTRPKGSRTGLGSLQLGFRDPDGRLHYAGGVGTGFSEAELDALTRRLATLPAQEPAGMLLSEEPVPAQVRWVAPELVAEVQFIGWSGGGRLRHAVWLGLREDKDAAEVVLPVPNPEAARIAWGRRRGPARIVRAAAPAKRETPSRGHAGPDQAKAAPARAHATPSSRTPDAPRLTHPDRELWPGVTKAGLAAYWRAVAPVALPGIAARPLALVRCPDGVAGEHFFQKHAARSMPPQIAEHACDGAPFLEIADLDGLLAATQMSVLELHSWGSASADAAHPDRLVFDLDPGEGVAWAQTVAAARDVRDRLAARGLAAFCRTSGGKGLHVVVPLAPRAGWDEARAWCRAFAEAMEHDAPARYVASTRLARRHGRILVDWLRNGLGSTAVASLSPRARDGATVATPLAWREVTPKLDPRAFTIATVPARLSRLRADPWNGFAAAARALPEAGPPPEPRTRRR